MKRTLAALSLAGRPCWRRPHRLQHRLTSDRRPPSRRPPPRSRPTPSRSPSSTPSARPRSRRSPPASPPSAGPTRTTRSRSASCRSAPTKIDLGRQRGRLDRLVRRRARRERRRRGAGPLRRRRRRTVDEIAKPQPDLILATNSGITEAEYDKLSKIASRSSPTPRLPWTTPVAESLEMVGQALGRSDARGRGRRPRPSRSIADAAAEYPQLEGATFSYARPQRRPLVVRIYAPQDNRRVSLCRPRDGRLAPRSRSAIKPGEFYGTVSAEQPAAARRPTCSSPGRRTPRRHETFADDQLVGQIPAVADGRGTPRRTSTSPRGHQPVAALDPVRHRALRPEVAAAVDGA